MADELGIDVPMDDKMMVEMDKQCNAVITSIENMKMTYAWMWVHTSGDSKENLKKFILQQLAIEQIFINNQIKVNNEKQKQDIRLN